MRVPVSIARSLFVWACVLGGACGSTPAGPPDGGSPALFFDALTAVALSPTAARLSFATNVPADVTITFSPADVPALHARSGDVLPTVFGLAPATAYTATAIATAGADSAEKSVSFTTGAARTIRVLFDAAHGESVGNANWAIDDDAGAPKPARPVTEKDWKGALSSWAFELQKTGRFEVETLGAGGVLTYQTPAPQDLARFDVLVLPEPNNWGDLGSVPKNPARGAAERAAVKAFVLAGGGLIGLADHAGSDRDSDGIDSARVFRRLFAALDGLDVGIDFPAGSREFGSTSTFRAGDELLAGPFGKVTRVAQYEGTTLLVEPKEGRRVRAIAYRDGVDPASDGANSYVYAAAAEVGEGRLFLYGDSSAANDGTGVFNNPDKAAWTDPNYTHPALFLNATSWAAREY